MSKKIFQHFFWLIIIAGCNEAGTLSDNAIINQRTTGDNNKSKARSLVEVKNAQNNLAHNSVARRYADIPEWYMRNRVQAHTLIGINSINDSDFFNFPKRLSQYGVSVLARQIKASDERPWWPSKFGTQSPESLKFSKNGKDLAKDIIDQMHSLNIKAIIYYRHAEDAEMFKKNPDWACKDINGKVVKGERGTMLSLNSPYRDVVFQRIKELAEDGADAFYFDYSHVPITGDFSDYSKKLYKEQYGTDMIADFKNNKVVQIGDFMNNTVLRFFSDMRKNLSASGYNPALLVSGNRWPTLTGLVYNSSLFNDFILKSELEVPMRVSFKSNKLWPFAMPESFKKQVPIFYLNAFTFSFMRDNSFGPPIIWSHGILDENSAESICAGLISLGCVAEPHINPKKSSMKVFSEVFKWNKKYGDYFADLVPYASVGILASEQQRNQFVNNPLQAWQNVLTPAYNAFEKFYKAGIPVKLISDAAVSDISNIVPIIYANKKLAMPDGLASNAVQDFSQINNLKGAQLAAKVGATVFCEKENEYTHLNYFTDNKGYLYIITSPDFKSAIMKEEVVNSGNDAVNLKYTTTEEYKKSRKFHLHLKNGFTLNNSLQDVVNNTNINSSKTENGYTIYNIDASGSTLGIYRIRLQ